jgi:hypothetical protein
MFWNKKQGNRTLYHWLPHEDITAYELALCLGVVLAVVSRIGGITEISAEKLYERLPDSAKRHWALVKDNDD